MTNKKILITGAGGFIGSHLVKACIDKGFRIKAFLHYNSSNHWGWLEQVSCKRKIEITSGDIRDYDSVYKALKGCYGVFHLAALIGIPYSYSSPLAYIKTNIEGTYNIVESAKELGIKNVLITSTSETYGSAQFIPMNENHPVIGQSPYAATKIAADQIALSYFNSFGLPVKIVRPFNTYGPRQSARAIVPATILQILSGEKTIRLGNLAPTRDLNFITDTVNGFLAIAGEKRCIGEITNIGSGKEIGISELVSCIARLMGTKIKIETDRTRLRPTKSEVKRLCCDNSKLMRLTNWKPRYNLEKGLQITIDWFKKTNHCYKSGIYNV
ncbi:MAG TPA: GDP-mannose 4,6-dehydratase [Candidatus Omnitrophota bacterium]|nr:GDP-mannose 4,6-dehydratase [Candidatus Omnitrophota bacterium]